jgi:cytochrome c553
MGQSVEWELVVVRPARARRAARCCTGCHGPSYSGGPGSDGLPAANITPTGIGHYTEEDFMRALRTGERPHGGAKLRAEMPWKFYGTMTDAELQSVWAFLKTVAPKSIQSSECVQPLTTAQRSGCGGTRCRDRNAA